MDGVGSLGGDQMDKIVPYLGDWEESNHPSSLQDICLNCLCDNLNEICVIKNIVVSPKRRRVSSGQSHEATSKHNTSSNVQSTKCNEILISDEGHDNSAHSSDLVNPNLRPGSSFCDNFEEHLVTANSRKSRKHCDTDGE